MIYLLTNFFTGLIPVFCRNIQFVQTMFRLIFFTLTLHLFQTLIRIVFSNYKSFYLNW